VATLIFSTIGSLVVGPIGALVGALGGGTIDRLVLGGRTTRREGPRLSDLGVQSSAYGEGVPLVYGHARVAGNVIWSSGLIESRHENTVKVGGKGGGKVRQVSYTYAVSLAIALSARKIIDVGRIWADGKLIRPGPDAALNVGGTLRIHDGGAGQQADPLLQAALGVQQTPAYRGLAYVTFERLELAEFANRVPNLTFEVIADDGAAIDLADMVDDLVDRSGPVSFEGSGWSGAVTGCVIGHDSTARRVIETLDAISPASLADLGDQLVLASAEPVAAVTVPDFWLGAGTGQDMSATWSEVRMAEAELPREVTVSYADPARDYQSAVQRARRMNTISLKNARVELPVAMTAQVAKQSAECRLARAWRERRTLSLRLPWRAIALARGDVFALEQRDELWRVDELTVEGGVVSLTARAVHVSDRISMAQASSGADIAQPVVEHGPTHLQMFELPAMGAGLPSTPTLWLAGAGDLAGWRRALVYGSMDQGQSYDLWADLTGSAAMGTLSAPLAPAGAQLWDRYNVLHLSLPNPVTSLEGRAEASVLAGANLLWVHGELIQFARADLVAPGDWRLSDLLRGRFGTESLAVHPAGAPVVLLSGSSLAALDLPTSAVGRTLLAKALSPYQTLGMVEAEPHVLDGLALRPLAPVHLQARREPDGAVRITWIRRSRDGYDWVDGIDAPLGEVSEAYDVEVLDAGTVVRSQRVSTPALIYTLADQIADTGVSAGTSIEVHIVQISSAVGRGIQAHRILAIKE